LGNFFPVTEPVMKHKVAELEGALLDAAVAKAEGIEVEYSFGQCRRLPLPGVVIQTYQPSRDWADGGPIIERERISIAYAVGLDYWEALHDERFDGNCSLFGTPYRGPTPLIAAMRSFVASRFGEEVELP